MARRRISPRSRGVRRGPHPFRPQLESLPDRLAPAVFSVVGTAAPNVIVITDAPGGAILLDGAVVATVEDEANTYDVRSLDGADTITVFDGPGDDVYFL